jgi:hypothetical protein
VVYVIDVCTEAEETAEHQGIKTKHNQMITFRLVCSGNEEKKDERCHGEACII